MTYDLANTTWVHYVYADIPTNPQVESWFDINFEAEDQLYLGLGVKNTQEYGWAIVSEVDYDPGVDFIIYAFNDHDWVIWGYDKNITFIDGDDIANEAVVSFMINCMHYMPNNLVNTYWKFNDVMAPYDSEYFFGGSFISNNTNYNFLSYTNYNEEILSYQTTSYPYLDDLAWSRAQGWTNNAYKQIWIKSTNSYVNSLIEFLYHNALMYFPDRPDVTVVYEGDELIALTDSATKTLKTAGKYCEDDITITYSKSSGGGSDVTTANVTIINRMGRAWTAVFPEISGGHLRARNEILSNNGSASYPAMALYNGYVTIYGVSPMQGYIASGDNVVQIGPAFYITGDGTVTLESDL